MTEQHTKGKASATPSSPPTQGFSPHDITKVTLRKADQRRPFPAKQGNLLTPAQHALAGLKPTGFDLTQ